MRLYDPSPCCALASTLDHLSSDRQQRDRRPAHNHTRPGVRGLMLWSVGLPPGRTASELHSEVRLDGTTEPTAEENRKCSRCLRAITNGLKGLRVLPILGGRNLLNT